MRTLIHALMLGILLSACSSSTEDKTQTQKDVVDSAQQPLDKAKGVEQEIFDSAEAQRKQAEGL